MAERQKGMGRGLAAILAVSPREDARGAAPGPARADRPEPATSRARSFDEEQLLGARRIDPVRGVLQPVLVRPLPGGRYELIAGERRWRAARTRRARDDPGDRPPPRRRGVARGGADREHGPRGPQPGRGGAGVRRPGRGARAHARGGRAAGRPQPGCRLEPDPPARPARRGARADRARRPDRGSRPGAAARRGSRRAAARWLGRPRPAGGRCANSSPGPELPAAPAPRPKRRQRRAGRLHPDQQAAIEQIADTLGAALGPRSR